MDTLAARIDEISGNCYLRQYPDGSAVLLCAERKIFREAGWEERRSKAKAAPGPDPVGAALAAAEAAAEAGEGSGAATAASDTSRARRRARAMVRDYALCSDLKWFVTFTLDKTRIDRYDVAEITKRLNVWLDNRVRRNGLRYILVPELHKDGAVHFHGLINDGALELTDSGTIVRGGGKPRRPRSGAERQRWLDAGGHVVYNVGDWGYGFSTAIALYGDPRRAVGYVTKYISKSAGKVGGRWYYSGGSLKLPKRSVMTADFDVIRAYADSKSPAAPLKEGENWKPQENTFTLEGLGCLCCSVLLTQEELEDVRQGLELT